MCTPVILKSQYNSVISARHENERPHEVAALNLKAVQLSHSELLHDSHSPPANPMKCVEMLVQLQVTACEGHVRSMCCRI